MTYPESEIQIKGDVMAASSRIMLITIFS